MSSRDSFRPAASAPDCGERCERHCEEHTQPPPRPPVPRGDLSRWVRVDRCAQHEITRVGDASNASHFAEIHIDVPGFRLADSAQVDTVQTLNSATNTDRSGFRAPSEAGELSRQFQDFPGHRNRHPTTLPPGWAAQLAAPMTPRCQNLGKWAEIAPPHSPRCGSRTRGRTVDRCA